ncbi:hypothetical protein [Actinoplanes rectilineatus]|uniref:hypothetical protein n=1 Tax=Actinoplanes rectilineatus TaxID=113571 RepID=UPI0005F2E500|nr:hypothetical protein [Actinoplanes rectilineatus]
MTDKPDPYAHLDDRQNGLCNEFEQQAGATGADLHDLLAEADLPDTDRAALAQAWGGPEAAAEFQPVPAGEDLRRQQRLEEITAAVRAAIQSSGVDARDALHEVSARASDKAAIARELCPDAETEWNGTPEQRTAGYDAHNDRTRARMEDRVLANADALAPDDRSPTAEQIRETAASVRDHREMAEQRAQWAAQDQATETGRRAEADDTDEF